LNLKDVDNKNIESQYSIIIIIIIIIQSSQ